VRVYPNPTSNSLNLEFNMIDESTVDIYLHDNTGNVDDLYFIGTTISPKNSY